jgi:hypothetical protein
MTQFDHTRAKIGGTKLHELSKLPKQFDYLVSPKRRHSLQLCNIH